MGFDSAGPSVAVYIADGRPLSRDFTGHIVKVEAELTRDIADQITITMLNPLTTRIGVGNNQNEFMYVDADVFLPGNEISVYMGYGGNNSFIARGIITKYLPSFPSDGIPKLTIKAQDASVRLMEYGDKAGASYPDMSYSDIVKQICNGYGIAVGEIESTPKVKNTVKKAGTNDYQFVKGLASLCGFECKVRWTDKAKKWQMYWRTPKPMQDRRYTFTYLNGPNSTLLSFEPQYGMRDAVSEIKVLYFDHLSRTWEELSVKEGQVVTSKKGKKKVVPNVAGDSAIAFTGDDRQVEEITSTNVIRVDIAGTSVEVVANRPFTCPEDALAFATEYFNHSQSMFITGQGKCIGVESLAPGQVHILTGLGKQLSGEYELTTVKHVFDNNGYTTEIFGNKVLKGLPERVQASQQ